MRRIRLKTTSIGDVILRRMLTKRHPAEAECLLNSENTILRIFVNGALLEGLPRGRGLLLFSVNSATDFLGEGFAIATQCLEVNLKIKHRLIVVRS